MAQTELNVLFKKQQKDDKKEVLKFEIKGDEDNVSLALYEMAGEIVNFELDGCDTGAITAEFAKINRDSKKTVLDFTLKGDSEEKALSLYKFAGHNILMYIEPSQMSLEDFNDDGGGEYNPEDDHEGIEYTVNLDGTTDLKDDNTKEENEDDLPI
ncbi:hypothetical protein D7Z54_14480 [Salibacterium salarium]|uniref:Uncharacterized protein n=1 Tax=Salibacterium salarium TaxID=284579 RepID=A0A3R9P718_9BACI|nr:hypothetical protein [Salibacterium salarium]RSL32654.1 hypothetical protein D7Z54_14480 [Salibacterium salarium]